MLYSNVKLLVFVLALVTTLSSFADDGFEANIQGLTQKELKSVLLKNYLAAVGTCSFSSIVAVGESIPILSAITKGGEMALVELFDLRDETLEYTFFSEHYIESEVLPPMLLGGPTNALINITLQYFSDLDSVEPLDLEEIKLHFNRGYISTIGTTQYRINCKETLDNLTVLKKYIEVDPELEHIIAP